MSSSVGLIVLFFHSSSSGISLIEGFGVVGLGSIACRANFFARSRGSRGWGFRRGMFFKNLRFLVSLQENSPVFQLISGLCSLSQGNPKIIRSFPNPVTNSSVLVFLPLISKLRLT